MSKSTDGWEGAGSAGEHFRWRAFLDAIQRGEISNDLALSRTLQDIDYYFQRMVERLNLLRRLGIAVDEVVITRTGEHLYKMDTHSSEVVDRMIEGRPIPPKLVEDLTKKAVSAAESAALSEPPEKVEREVPAEVETHHHIDDLTKMLRSADYDRWTEKRDRRKDT